jgi:hypothetical protein
VRKPAAVVIRRLAGSDDVSSFCCGYSQGDVDLNGFLRDDARPLEASHVTRVYVACSDAGEVVGFVAILADAIVLKSGERKKLKLPHRGMSKYVPALKVGRLAVSDDFRREYEGTGTLLVRQALDVAMLLSERAGCRLLTVDAYGKSVDFYLKRGFIKNKVSEHQPTIWERARAKFRPLIDPVPSTIPMRFDLRASNLPSWAR